MVFGAGPPAVADVLGAAAGVVGGAAWPVDTVSVTDEPAGTVVSDAGEAEITRPDGTVSDGAVTITGERPTFCSAPDASAVVLPTRPPGTWTVVGAWVVGAVVGVAVSVGTAVGVAVGLLPIHAGCGKSDFGVHCGITSTGFM